MPVAGSAKINRKRFRVRSACHTQVDFSAPDAETAHVLVDYYRKKKLLARERRPIAAGDSAIQIKTHPAATHVECEVTVGDKPVPGRQFGVECGDDIEPVGRHFIVIGAMKAGTTTLFEMLARHPALCRTWVEVPDLSYGKEINYFTGLYRKRHKPVHYDWRFPFDTARHAWTLDVSPNYAKLPASKRVPARIASLGANTKIAYIMRDPVDRIESQMAHALKFKGKVTSEKHCIRVSRYARHLDRFMARIPGDDFLLLDFERLRKDSRAILHQVCDFLDIERFDTKAAIHNRRGVNFKLTPAQRAAYADALRPDVERLIDDYGFSPAEKWLQKERRSWFRLPANRR